ncbi:hypothetical protein ACB098_11G118000 [Castanea mollissima]
MSSISTQKASLWSSSTPQWKYDVFLSFRGEDTRNSFTDHLYVALKQKGIITFRDEEKLERGKSISPEIFKAIEESRFVVVILSKNYATSTWCLNELVKIIECMKEMKTTVFPIFYDVDPSNVRKQTGSFAQAFSKHEECFKDFIENVHTWRAALREVANLKGWHLLDRSEAQLIQNIVGELLHKLNYASLEDIEDLVGITSRVKELESYLAIGFNDVRIIGVWGMGGIGKTTLARVVFDTVLKKFEGCCFLPNVREVCEKDGLIPLQQLLIRKILNESVRIQDVDEGLFVIKNRLRHKKILLVLDDVNQLDQLKKLVGKGNWFGSGSRVIITTRDKHLLRILKVDKIYEAKGLDNDEALHLLCLKAFTNDHPPKDYLALCKEVVQYTKGLPLAIEILGSFLFSRDIDQWKSTLNRLKEFPKSEILQVLKISFDGLDEVEKEIFLHIACFFNNEIKDDIVEKLDYLGLYPNVGLGVLVDKSLVKMDETTLWMHDLLQEMGRNIVYQECPKEPGKRSKLWLFEDVDDVLTKNMETEAIQGIVLNLPTPKEAHWNLESFSKMQHLKLLIIDNVYVLHGPKHLPNGLRILDWGNYPSKFFPSSFQSKSFQRLKSIRIRKSLKLVETPVFTEVPFLEKLVLEDCLNLSKVHPSIVVLKKLTFLSLKGCKNLKSLPKKFEMESLETLILSGCSKIKQIPKFGENMQHILKLYLDGTAIKEIPSSIGLLKSLKVLSFGGCKGLSSFKSTSYYELLPFYSMPKSPHPVGLSSLLGLCSLTELNLRDCNLMAIPDDIGYLLSLREIDLRENGFVYLPDSIGRLCKLRTMDLENCKSLRSLPKLPLSIVAIGGYGCTSLETIPDLLKPNSICEAELYFSNCSKLTDSQGVIDMFFTVIRKHLQGLSLKDRYCHEGFDSSYHIVIPGSVIPKWFIHQSMGAKVNTKVETSSHLRDEWMGIAVCVVFSCLPHHHIDNYCDCEITSRLIVNGKEMNATIGTIRMVGLSDHKWLFYLLPQYYVRREDIKLLKELEENEFSQIGIKIEKYGPSMEVKKCGFRMVYKKDIEDLNQTVAQSSSTTIIPYEDLGVLHHNFDNSEVLAECNKANQTHDDYDGAGPSGEGSLNELPHSQRNERFIEFLAHGDSDCEEYLECSEELGDWQKSSESDLKV